MRNSHGLHSFAVFLGTDMCPLSRDINEIMNGTNAHDGLDKEDK